MFINSLTPPNAAQRPRIRILVPVVEGSNPSTHPNKSITYKNKT